MEEEEEEDKKRWERVDRRRPRRDLKRDCILFLIHVPPPSPSRFFSVDVRDKGRDLDWDFEVCSESEGRFDHRSRSSIAYGQRVCRVGSCRRQLAACGGQRLGSNQGRPFAGHSSL